MSNLYGLIRKASDLLVINSFFLFFTASIAHSSSVPESFADLAEKLSPSVVNISTTTVIEQKSREMPSFPPGSPFEDFFKQFEKPGGKKRKAQSLGSGFIIDKSGYIITNNHVIEDATKIEVTTNDNVRYEAELIGTDPYTDIAVLKIKSEEKLPYLYFGNSDTTQIGEWVLAIGNPFNLNSTS